MSCGFGGKGSLLLKGVFGFAKGEAACIFYLVEEGFWKRKRREVCNWQRGMEEEGEFLGPCPIGCVFVLGIVLWDHGFLTGWEDLMVTSQK